MKAALLLILFACAEPLPPGDAVIRGDTPEGPLVITTTRRLAGAIHSLAWNGREFIDSTDHGRQLQSASNFDLSQPFTPETFNPTEAGSRDDGAGPTSSSQLLHLLARGPQLQTTTRMAFWLTPGQTSSSHPAKNRVPLSDHLLTKRVTIGWRNLPRVIQYDVSFSVPLGEKHTYAQFEAVTGYMPAEFSRFWNFNPATRELEPLTAGPGEQPFPVVLATEDGRYAMGVFSPDQPSPGYTTAGYGRFAFPAERVTKWNCVFRLRNPQGVPPGDYSFRNFVLVGTLTTVQSDLQTLHTAFPAKKSPPPVPPNP